MQVFQGNTDQSYTADAFAFAHSLVPKCITLTVLLLFAKFTSGAFFQHCMGNVTIAAK